MESVAIRLGGRYYLAYQQTIFSGRMRAQSLLQGLYFHTAYGLRQTVFARIEHYRTGISGSVST